MSNIGGIRVGTETIGQEGSGSMREHVLDERWECSLRRVPRTGEKTARHGIFTTPHRDKTPWFFVPTTRRFEGRSRSSSSHPRLRVRAELWNC